MNTISFQFTHPFDFGFSGRKYALLSFLNRGSAVIVLFVLISGFSLWGEEPRISKKAKILFIGNSFLASAGGQENLVPAMMKSHGWEVEANHCYGPGQSLKGHWHNNLGELTEEQIKDTATVKRWLGDRYDMKAVLNMYKKYKGKLDDALAHGPYDFVVMIPSSVEYSNFEKYETFKYGRMLVEKVRKTSPQAKFTFVVPWSTPGNHLPEYVVTRLALENGGMVAPIHRASEMIQKNQPTLQLRRSIKDGHPGLRGAYLIACILFTTITKTEPIGLPFSLRKIPSPEDSKENRFSILPEEAIVLQGYAQKAVYEFNEKFRTLRLEELRKPKNEIQQFVSGETKIGEEIFFVANAWYDADRKLYRILEKMLQPEGFFINIYADDAATLQSHLFNNQGKLTPRQEEIIQSIQKLSASMGKEKYDMDALDGMGDYPANQVLQTLLARAGKLDKALAFPPSGRKKFIVMPFRDAVEPEKYDFFESGKKLINKLQQSVPLANMMIFQPWASQDHPETQKLINENCRKLAQNNEAILIPVGTAWAKVRTQRPDLKLHTSRYTPNDAGIYLTACVLYVRITGNSPEKLPLAGCNIPEETAKFLRQVALDVCM